MKFVWPAVLGLLLASSCTAAVQKKTRTWVFLMPVSVKAEVSDDEMKSLPLLARASVISAFEERDILSVSPVQMQVTEREMDLKLDDEKLWTPEFFEKLTARWKSRYIATVRLVSIETKEGRVEGLPPTPPPPGGQLNTTAKVEGSLYDTKEKKFIFENQESVASLKVGRPGPGEKQVNSERLRSVMEACRGLFKEFLSKFPKKKPSVGLGAGGG